MTMSVENNTGLPRPWRPVVTAKVDSRAEPYVAGGYAEALDTVRRLEHDQGLQPISDTAFKAKDDASAKIENGKKLDVVAIFGPAGTEAFFREAGKPARSLGLPSADEQFIDRHREFVRQFFEFLKPRPATDGTEAKGRADGA